MRQHSICDLKEIAVLSVQQGGLDEAQKREIVQHGAALGLGVASLASESTEVFEELMNLLYHHDSAVAGIFSPQELSTYKHCDAVTPNHLTCVR